MKKLLLLILLMPFVIQAQVTRTVTFDGVSRSYIEYVPSSYDGTTAVPVVFAFHGLGDMISNFSNVGFHQLAEQHNFIVITPQALEAVVFGFPFGTAWNSGASTLGQTLNPDVDDVGFVSFMIDSLDANYNINTSKVFATGFSMGGFFSNRLACELNDRIAAIGSVAGTIGNALDCMPGRAVPMVHFHGTADGTIAYTGNSFGTDAEATVEFWANNSNCETTPSITPLADAAADGITVEHYVYNGCDVEVEFYKATGAEHQWLFKPTNDISYSEKIWEFFSRQSLPGADCSSVVVDLGEDKVTCNSAVTLDASTEDATYLWNNGSTTATITATESGTYSVEITVDGCTASDNIEVAIEDELDVDLGPDLVLIDSESVTLDATSDNATYIWSNGSTQATLDVTVAGTYWVEVTNVCGTVRDTVVIDFVTGLLNNQTGFKFNLYPNPISESGIIEITAEASVKMNIVVMDVLGQQLKSIQHNLVIGDNSVPIELSELTKGAYILVLDINGEKSSKPFIVE